MRISFSCWRMHTQPFSHRWIFRVLQIAATLRQRETIFFSGERKTKRSSCATKAVTSISFATEYYFLYNFFLRFSSRRNIKKRKKFTRFIIWLRFILHSIFQNILINSFLLFEIRCTRAVHLFFVLIEKKSILCWRSSSVWTEFYSFFCTSIVYFERNT